MLQGKILGQFKAFKIYKDLYGKPLNHDWVSWVIFLVQILQIFEGYCNCYFLRYTAENLQVT